jgi:hypothetical protein
MQIYARNLFSQNESASKYGMSISAFFKDISIWAVLILRRAADGPPLTITGKGSKSLMGSQ